MIQETEIQEPVSGTEHEKLQHLLAIYTQRLKDKIPAYKLLPDDSLIPDMLLVALRSKVKAGEKLDSSATF